MKRFLIPLLALASGLAALAPAAAQPYPNRPIKLLVGFAAGGITDITARTLQEEMGAALGQPVVIENRTGAGGNIASAELARAAPDGYTLMLASPGQLIVNPLTQKSLGFDPKTAFTPIGQTNTSPFVMVVPATSKFKTVAELVAAGKAAPGALSYGSPGIGTTMHIGGEMLQMVADLKAVHIPYKGGAQATNDLIAGRVDFMIDSLGAVSSQVEAGQLRVLASASAKRLARFPDKPALSETWPEFELSSWLGIVGPPKLPPEIVATLAKALQRTVRSKKYVELTESRGSQPVDADPVAFAAHLARERARVERTVVKAGLQLD